MDCRNLAPSIHWKTADFWVLYMQNYREISGNKFEIRELGLKIIKYWDHTFFGEKFRFENKMIWNILDLRSNTPLSATSKTPNNTTQKLFQGLIYQTGYPWKVQISLKPTTCLQFCTKQRTDGPLLGTKISTCSCNIASFRAIWKFSWSRLKP